MVAIDMGRRDPRLDEQLSGALEGRDVERWWYELGLDASGAPSVWVWLVLPDAVAKTLGPEVMALSQELGDIVHRDGRYWPYVYFRSKSEQEALEK